MPLKSMLPPPWDCNPAHSGVPGPAQDAGHDRDVSQGLKTEVQGHRQGLQTEVLFPLRVNVTLTATVLNY